MVHVPRRPYDLRPTDVVRQPDDDAVAVCGRSVPHVGVGDVRVNPAVAACMIHAHSWGGFFPKLVA